MNNDPTNHECTIDLKGYCNGCQALLELHQTQETAPRKPDYSFKRTNQCADYPAGFNVI
jgi:hypothetical protein